MAFVYEVSTLKTRLVIKTDLQVGDVCITLCHIEGGEVGGTSRGTIPSGSRGGAVPSSSGIQQLSRPTSLIQATCQRLTVIHFERRSGVRSAPSNERPTEELALRDMHRRLMRRRNKSAPL